VGYYYNWSFPKCCYFTAINPLLVISLQLRTSLLRLFRENPIILYRP
jgi:hypothetical protein